MFQTTDVAELVQLLLLGVHRVSVLDNFALVGDEAHTCLTNAHYHSVSCFNVDLVSKTDLAQVAVFVVLDVFQFHFFNAVLWQLHYNMMLYKV
jgi:hypothetical protein